MLIGIAVLTALLAAAPIDAVDPFIGTGGTSGTGLIDDYPGASAPFGMLQWSPDTPSLPPSGGYLYRDKEIDGFSLTHLSGAGCLVFGDVSIAPVTGDVTSVSQTRQSFTHENEHASPGYYAVQLGAPPISVELATTQRTGLGSFTFPATPKANIVVNTGASQAGITGSTFQIIGSDEVAGSASSGGFCGMPNVYTLYFDVKFDRPFVDHGVFAKPQSGGWLRFDATRNAVVRAKASVSYVSIDGARRNIAAEAQTWDVAQVKKAGEQRWNALLGEVDVTGGTGDDRKMLYTSLYHALLSPTVYSDADGSYRGFDGRVHRASRGHSEYSNFSGWDIYRTQVPLMGLLAPRETSDMMQSLVHDAQQGGWLPKWPVANAYTGVMGGDSADPIIAGAYAFGAKDFDGVAALRAMIKGADDTTSTPGQGWYYPRPGLDEYLKRGYVVNVHTASVSPVPNGASATLEYAYDDFSISRLALALKRDDVYRRFAKRAQNWTNLFDTASGLIAPRDADGAFMHTPLTDNGQSGFQEGNAYQYTWMVPQGWPALIGALGGQSAAQARLDSFFTEINAGQDKPFAWFGNEPSLTSPWVYTYTGAPHRASYQNRVAMRDLYEPTPDGIPGNDDLGTMSAWWVWNAMGLYPANPAVRMLFAAAPLFPHVTIASPSGLTIDLDAPGALRENAYVTGVRINGKPANRAWFALPDRGSLRIQYTVAPEPNARFAVSPQSAPPGYAYGPVRFPPSTALQLSTDAASIAMAPGSSAPLRFTITNSSASTESAKWTAHPPAGITLTPSSGTATAAATIPFATELTAQAAPALSSGLYDVPITAVASNGAPIARATAVFHIAAPGETLPLAYVANFSDGTVTPFDPRTLAYGSKISVGKSPGGLALSADGSHLYTANQNSNDISVVDTQAQKNIATIAVGKVPAGIQITRDGRFVWFTNFGDGTLQSIDTRTLRAGKTISIGTHLEGLALSPDGSRAYVVVQGSDQLAAVDLTDGQILGRVDVGRLPVGVAVTGDGRSVYVSNSASNDVTVIHASSLHVVATLPVGKSPQGIIVSPDDSQVYVADAASSQVTPIDVRTNTAREPIKVGYGPFDVAFRTDGRYAFAANSGDNTTSVIDVTKRQVIATIPTGSFPIAFATPR